MYFLQLMQVTADRNQAIMAYSVAGFGFPEFLYVGLGIFFLGSGQKRFIFR